MLCWQKADLIYLRGEVSARCCTLPAEILDKESQRCPGLGRWAWTCSNAECPRASHLTQSSCLILLPPASASSGNLAGAQGHRTGRGSRQGLCQSRCWGQTPPRWASTELLPGWLGSAHLSAAQRVPARAARPASHSSTPPACLALAEAVAAMALAAVAPGTCPCLGHGCFPAGQHHRGVSRARFGSGGQFQPQVPLSSPHAALPPISVITVSALASLLPSLPQLAEDGKGLVPAAHLRSPSHPLRCGALGSPGMLRLGPAFVTGVCPLVPARVVSPPPERAKCKCPSLRRGARACTRYLHADVELLCTEHRRAGCRAGACLQLLERCLGSYCRLWQPLVKLRCVGGFPL